jgi:hypothetical protein
MEMEPERTGGVLKAILIIGILLLLIAGGLVFATQKGWISLFGSKSTTEPELTYDTGTSGQNQETGNVGITNDQQRKADLASIKEALEKYKLDNGSYPVSSTTDKTNDPSGVLMKTLVPKYLATLPVDPADPQYYYGYKSADGATFELTCVIENANDVEATKVGNIYLYKLTN